MTRLLLITNGISVTLLALAAWGYNALDNKLDSARAANATLVQANYTNVETITQLKMRRLQDQITVDTFIANNNQLVKTTAELRKTIDEMPDKIISDFLDQRLPDSLRELLSTRYGKD